MATSSLRAPAARDSAGVDAALLILRVVLGLLMLLHGVNKLPPPPPEFLTTALSARGLPSVLAYGVYLGEIVGPILIIVGIWTRLGALLIVGNMVVAVLLAHARRPAPPQQAGRLRARAAGDVPVHRRRADPHGRRALQRRRPLRAAQLVDVAPTASSNPPARRSSALAGPRQKIDEPERAFDRRALPRRPRRCRPWPARTAPAARRPAPGPACSGSRSPACSRSRRVVGAGELAHRGRAVGEHAQARCERVARGRAARGSAATCAPAVDRVASGK